MAVCDETCNCDVEGDRGLVLTGDGEAATPYVVSPDEGRTIPSTWDTYADLPVLADEEVGQLGFVRDTGLLYVWTIDGSTLEDGWQVVAPDWVQGIPADVVVAATGITATSAGIDLLDGRWDVIAKGYVEVAVGVGDMSVVRLDLVDTVSATIFDRKVVSLPNDSAAPRAMTMPFSLQRLVSSGLGATEPVDGYKTMAINVIRDSIEAGVGSVLQIKMRAVRVSPHSVF